MSTPNQTQETINILLVGVGGQGTILAAKVLSQMALNAGYDVKMSEIKGMSQRGGSVVTQVRIGNDIASPTIDRGEADYIVAFEQLEGYRWAEYMKPTGILIANDQQIEPMPVIMGVADYPEKIPTKLSDIGITIYCVNALDIALDCGNAKTLNIVLLGHLAKRLPIDKSHWISALEQTIPARLLECNKQAFEKGLIQ